MLHFTKMHRLGLFALVLLLFLALPAPANDLRGTLINIDGDIREFAMIDENLNEYFFRLAKNGKVFINDKEAELTDLQAGDEVTVVYELLDKQPVATVLRCKRSP